MNGKLLPSLQQNIYKFSKETLEQKKLVLLCRMRRAENSIFLGWYKNSKPRFYAT
jgi:hypothetical protein